MLRSVDENLADLPTRCDHGCKRNSQGFTETWIGYKLHLDVVDGDLPISAILTSAFLHDCQVAIPLAQTSHQRVLSLYDLMDAAYDAKEIHTFSRQQGHVPIIDPNPRGGEKIPMAPATARRFKQRSSSERSSSGFVARPRFPRRLRARDSACWPAPCSSSFNDCRCNDHFS